MKLANLRKGNFINCSKKKKTKANRYLHCCIRGNLVKLENTGAFLKLSENTGAFVKTFLARVNIRVRADSTVTGYLSQALQMLLQLLQTKQPMKSKRKEGEREKERDPTFRFSMPS